MCDFQTSMQLHEYNAGFHNFFIFNCGCYTDYGNFSDYIYTEKNSYMACIVVVIDNVSKLGHKKIPIMIGSQIDFHIRKREVNDCTLYGCFIIEGYHKQINYFITNNCYNGHVYKTRGKPPHKPPKTEYVLKLRQNSVTMILKYDPEVGASDVGHTSATTSPISCKIYDELFIKNADLKYKFDRSDAMNDAEIKQALEHSLLHSPYLQHQPESKVSSRNNKIQKRLIKNKQNYLNNYDTDMINKAKGIKWIDFVNQCSPLHNIHKPFSEKDYEDYFLHSTRCAPDLDDLANKTCLSPGTILLRALECLIQKVKTDANTDTKVSMPTRLTNMMGNLDRVMKSGNMFFALSPKNDTKLMADFSTIYLPVEAQKLHLTTKLNSKIKRAINSQTKNSQALMFPRDGLDFNCPIEAKEMKAAGENIAPAQLVFSPRRLNFSKVNKVLQKVCHIGNLDNDNNNNCSCDNACSLLRVVINTYLTEYLINKCKLKQLKENCPLLPLMIYSNRYINLNSNGHIIMKYSQRYGFFVTPHEKEHLWKDAFTSYHTHLAFGSIAMYLPTTMDISEPAKTVVSSTNIKGRCDLINNYFHAIAFLNTVGTSNAALIHRPQFGDTIIDVSYYKDCDSPLRIPVYLKMPQFRYLKYGEIGHNAELPETVKNIFLNFSPNTEDLSEYYGVSYNDIIDNAEETFERIDNIIKYWYEDHFILTNETPLLDKFESEHFTPLNYKTHAKLTLEDKHNKLKHLKQNDEDLIYLDNKKKIPLYVMYSKGMKKEYRKKCTKVDVFKNHPPQMILWTAFGDIGGGTNEDGIILDNKVSKFGPTRLVSLTLNVKFMEAGKKLKKTQNITKSLSIFYIPMNNKTGNILNIGTLKSTEALTVTKSKNVYIREVKIGFEYHYTVTYEDTNEYKKTIESYYLDSNSTLNFHVRYMCPLGIGTKLSNLHGQKGVVSKVTDLSKYCAYKRDGTIVVPQVLFSITSLVGRTVASQVLGMLCSKDVAFTSQGGMVAPMGFNVHNIESSTKCKQTLIKNDLMTAENGFNSNLLSTTSSILKLQGPGERYKNPLHFVRQLHSMSGAVLQPLGFDHELLEDVN